MKALGKLIDDAIEARKKALTSQVEMLDILLFELKRDNPNVNICLRGIGLTRDYMKKQLDGKDDLTFIKKILNVCK